MIRLLMNFCLPFASDASEAPPILERLEKPGSVAFGIREDDVLKAVLIEVCEAKTCVFPFAGDD